MSTDALQLRELRHQALMNEENEAGSDQPLEREASLREKTLQAQAAEDKNKETAQNKLENIMANPAHLGTAWLLRWSWVMLIPSFGLTLIWINIHAFMRILPMGDKIFCKLGDEWKTGYGHAGGPSRSVGLFEVAGLIFLDLAVLLGIIILFASVMVIFDLVFNFGWFEIIKEVVKEKVS